jgi:hypothetical protein
MLTRENVILHLINRGILTMRDLVEDEITVLDVSRRNRNFLAMRRGGRGVMVKQAEDWEASRPAGLTREAFCLELARESAALQTIIPGFVDFDTRAQILVLELVEGAESMLEYQLRTESFPAPLAAQLGRHLATSHHEFGKALRFTTREAPFPGKTPWVLMPHQLEITTSADQSAGQAAVVRIVQSFPALSPALVALGDQWHVNGIMHGDMKWSNCLCREADAGFHLWLVDWELADAGNVAWDVGGVFQSYLALWVRSMHAVEGGTIGDVAATAAYPLAVMGPAIRAFWAAYHETLAISGGAARTLLEESIRYAAARLVQTAYEEMDDQEEISGQAVLQLQLSANILANPLVMLRDVLEVVHE